MDLHKAKRAAGIYAANEIEEKAVVALGTGSTVFYFIQHLIKRVQQGLCIKTVASSQASCNQAEEGGLEVVDVSDVTHIDIMVDGADEIDPQHRMIKGGGGAMLKEKILATASKKRVIIINESKCVNQLGAFLLPVEVVFYGATFTSKLLEQKGYRTSFRKDENNELFVTENGNLIADIQLPSLRDNPEAADREIKNIPGVIETGFFFGLADQVVIGSSDGSVKCVK